MLGQLQNDGEKTTGKLLLTKEEYRKQREQYSEMSQTQREQQAGKVGVRPDQEASPRRSQKGKWMWSRSRGQKEPILKLQQGWTESVRWKLKIQWLVKTRRYNNEEFGNPSESRAELDKQRDQLKLEMECLDKMAPFFGQDGFT